MKTFPVSGNKRRLLVFTATTLVSLLIYMRKAKISSAPLLLHPALEQGSNATPRIFRLHEKKKRRHVCPNRIDSLDVPTPGKEWHIGGWAVQKICSQPLDTLFFVHTAPSYWENRVHLRATLFEEAARIAFNWTGVFFVGQHKDSLVNLWTKTEAEVTGDIVVFPYNDTFVTILYKFVSGMRWVTEHCPNVRNIVKIDDDVTVQPFELRRYLDRTLPLKVSSIHGFVFVDMDVIRHHGSKYCIPEDELAMDTYPLYCSGRAMIMTMDTMQKLFRASKVVKGYAIDDAYVSGHLALFANIGHVNMSSISWVRPQQDKTEQMLRGEVMFRHEYFVYGKSIGRRVQWGLMLWMNTMQALQRHSYDYSSRFADEAYSDDFLMTRRALHGGWYLPTPDNYS
ncbi:acetylgalactosaminyl-O-glycosyl-glycoprotein beta-1,3-N-acetylglucosaminyltransferase-like [Rhipicephalus microplus]|uniref:acetylgalactosaminyl-O-glycosyl-glycoprotein beta-1,3-N-acetylglucosaminyltransferase-like n=1 Tax=Rhipicephalus microplus TaxID=6941 RepID=UPI003F6CC11A